LPTLYLVDYHIHSTLSEDAVSTPEEIVRVALERGLDEIVFTEHLEFVPPPDLEEPAFIPQRVLAADEYRRTAESLRERFGDRLRIGMGVELGLEGHNLDALATYLQENDLPLDYVLGSLHSIGGTLIQLPEFTDPLGPAGAARLYFDRLLEGIRRAADLGACDVVGHFDLVKRSPTFGRFRLQDHREHAEHVLGEIISAGIGLEVNTSGYRQAPGEPYPGLETLKLYRQMGGEIVTVGSDSHRAATVGLESERALDFVRAAGFEHITLFTGRNPSFKAI